MKYHDGADFDSADVKAQFERNAGPESSNKQKELFRALKAVETPDAHTVVIRLDKPRSLLPFELGQAVAVILDQGSFSDANTNPIGTGPYRFVKWTKGDSVELEKFDGHRNAAMAQIRKVKFRFINDATAQVAALLAGDLDYMPSLSAPEMFSQFQADDRFTSLQGTTEGETIIAMNNQHPALSDVRVRRAIMHAIDRQALIDGAMAGYGTPIGSHFAPHHPAYVDLTGALSLRSRAGQVAARRGGPRRRARADPAPAAAELRAARRRGGRGDARRCRNHREDRERGMGAVARERLQGAPVRDHHHLARRADGHRAHLLRPRVLHAVRQRGVSRDPRSIRAATTKEEQFRELQAAQRLVADDAVNGFLFSSPKLGVAQKGLIGMWPNWPAFINDVSALKWE